MNAVPTPKPSLKNQQRQRTRRRLVNVALSLYASDGYESTSVDEICKRAALSKGAFYFHFSGKEDVLAEALKELGEHETTGSGPIWKNADGGMSLMHEGDHGWNAGVPASLQLELWAQALRQENVRHYLRQRRTRTVFELRRAHAPEGTDDIEALTLGLVTLRDGLVLQSLLFPDDPIRGRLEAAIVALARRAAAGEALGAPEDARIEKRSA